MKKEYCRVLEFNTKAVWEEHISPELVAFIKEGDTVCVETGKDENPFVCGTVLEMLPISHFSGNRLGEVVRLLSKRDERSLEQRRTDRDLAYQSLQQCAKRDKFLKKVEKSSKKDEELAKALELYKSLATEV